MLAFHVFVGFVVLWLLLISISISVDHIIITFQFLSCLCVLNYNVGNFGPWFVKRKEHTPVFSWTQESNFCMFTVARES